MIKFFRKIRKNLLIKGKTTQYLKYAIGEIVLVVIGILIALQINNLNEKRNQQNTLQNIYKSIKSDLQEDIKNIDNVIEVSIPLEKDYLAIINQTWKKRDLKNCSTCWAVNMGYADLKIRQNGINLLLDYNKINNTTKDSLTLVIYSLYNDLVNDIHVDLEELKKDTQQFLIPIADSQPWFANLGKGLMSDEFIEYALTDVRYRNYATMIHYILYGKYIPDLVEFKSKGEEIISLIDKKLEND
ncbi:hypothetical protein OD91_2096 [Lutibacter sp. Hel_I_33_5]|uniref:DUF6090 family protein n=1 Tax=Lutibacter sp. Hel_I_33_5 TaxID=1566289 RepID=UPI0011A24F18|nr:DUF6090 family protein [Lutibacter sp. Hel_I_33_5]TVZ56797.1 hypothetical protein OD91_2096 [Lutibacter sp. Hel_I_33_5]